MGSGFGLLLGVDATPPAAGGIALVAHGSAGAAAGSTATTAGLNCSGANLLVAAVASYVGRAGGAGSPPALSDSSGNTWTRLTERGGGSVETCLDLYYVASPTVGAGQTFTATSAGGFAGLCVAAFSGAAAVPFDAESGASSVSAASLQPGSITPAAAGELLVAALGFSAALTVAIDSSFSVTDSRVWSSGQNEGCALAYLVQAGGPTAVNPAWSWGGSSQQVSAAMAAFKHA